MRRNPAEIVEAPVHEVAHICPPVVSVHGHANQMVVVACDGDDLDKVGGAIIARFTTIHAGIPEEKLVAVEQWMAGMLVRLRYNIGFSAADLVNGGIVEADIAKD